MRQQLQARAAAQDAGVDRPPSLGEVFTIRARVTARDLTRERVALIRIGGAHDELFQVLDWR